MFKTLTLKLQITNKVDNNISRSFTVFNEYFKDFKKEARNNTKSEFRGINSSVFIGEDEVNIIFIATQPDFLVKIQNQMQTLINKAVEKTKTDLPHSFKTGSII